MTSPVAGPADFVTFPGAVRPTRHHWVDSYGVHIAVCDARIAPGDAPALR